MRLCGVCCGCGWIGVDCVFDLGVFFVVGVGLECEDVCACVVSEVFD